MRIWFSAIFLTFIISCSAPYSYNYYKEYAYNDGAIALGMTTQEVRQAIGSPDKIELPEAVVTPFTPSGNPQLAAENQQFWVYPENNNKDLVLMFKGTTLVKIGTVEKL